MFVHNPIRDGISVPQGSADTHRNLGRQRKRDSRPVRRRQHQPTWRLGLANRLGRQTDLTLSGHTPPYSQNRIGITRVVDRTLVIPGKGKYVDSRVGGNAQRRRERENVYHHCHIDAGSNRFGAAQPPVESKSVIELAMLRIHRTSISETNQLVRHAQVIVLVQCSHGNGIVGGAHRGDIVQQ